jgi:hypothetical protein
MQIRCLGLLMYVLSRSVFPDTSMHIEMRRADRNVNFRPRYCRT